MGEFIGTFTLVFIGTAVATLTGVHQDDWGDTGLLAISMAFGFTLMVLVWVIGPVSGCHLNPAVSIPMALAGRMRASLLPGYLIAQFLGGFLASLVLWGLVSGLPNYEPIHGLGANWNARNMNLASLFGVELVLSSLFIMVIFSTTRRDALRGFEAWAIWRVFCSSRTWSPHTGRCLAQSGPQSGGQRAGRGDEQGRRARWPSSGCLSWLRFSAG